MLTYINNYFAGLSARRFLITFLAASLLIAVLDYLSGPELSFSVFYTLPLLLAAWYRGRGMGLTVAIVSVGLWLLVELALGSQYSGLLVPVWNTLTRLIFFLIILWLLLIVRAKLAFEESLADTDPLTGLANRRFFQEQLERESNRIHRYPQPFTIAYLDLDNFKHVNDSMGHAVGDELLKVVAKTLSTSIRASDFAARLGGDEFAVLFPVLEKESALPVLEKLSTELLSIMQGKKWPVTFSIGAVTFSEAMDSSRDMIKKVDDLMYEVKRSGKNAIRHLAWPDQN
ncbi:GGDEF domain-containing protein [Sulfuriflexus mobilis]|uniref:GGDEF domain-containing protein n=1 Tax=Sulfuriflexus mobilis TaxID=1811807 RepID=UPI000F817AC4|nr:GGDEF domain-containing protein [Sulfuriflexus mobilis]